MVTELDRRDFLTAGVALGLGSVSPAARARGQTSESPKSAQQAQSTFKYCLNTSTIRGQELTVPRQIEVAAQAGYDGIEPWIRDLDSYVASGGSIKDLRKRISDAGLTVESVIGFAAWIVDDDGERAKGLEEARRSMDLVARLGGSRLAAPPVGATRERFPDLFRAAERYRALLELGRKMGVVPQLEVWGFSKTLSRLGEAVLVAVESAHPDACLLPDVYHIYKGGSEFAGLKLLGPAAIHVFHVNDYPADPPREKIGDADRVYPGDGIAPLAEIFRTLADVGFRGALSLELFNREYWKQDALAVARTGLAKTRAAVAAAHK
jgi:sugar phosphate isomerase/epimerase